LHKALFYFKIFVDIIPSETSIDNGLRGNIHLIFLRELLEIICV